MMFAKCPKCDSEDYNILFIEGWEYKCFGVVTALMKVKCDDCGNEFWVRENYEFESSVNN